MGQSVTTPLSLTLQHWKYVRNTASNQSVDVRKKKWIALCSTEWPTFDVGWPQEGAFNLNIILQVKAKIINPGPRDHSDQVAYIVTWEALVNDPPPWVKPFITPECPPLTLSSPSSVPSAPFLPSMAPTTSSLYPALIEDTHSAQPKVKKPEEPKTAPPKVLPPSQDLLIDLLSDEPPPYQGSEPGQPGEAEITTKGPAEGSPVPEKPAPSPMAGRLRGRREPPPDSTSHAFPLRAGLNGQPQYWPFSASDLYNWKNNNPPFSKDPSMLTSLIESILVTHQPTWDDCQQLLQALLTSEEKQRVLLEARKNVPGENGRPTQLPNVIDAAFPLERPDWDFTTAEGRNHLRLYRQLLIAGLRGAARRPTNLAQVKQIIQGSEETPSAFLERLKEAYRMYTPYDPEDPGQATNVSMSFIWQSAPDIRKKLERLDNLRESTLQDLLKEAER
uniref:Gag polyprotein n=1 Tax=Catagonus wagneri TaxID=51154 RepID=A0A8C3VUX5_9CETA